MNRLYNRSCLPEWLFVLYFWGFVFLRPINQIVGGYSFIILAAFAGSITLLSLLHQLCVGASVPAGYAVLLAVIILLCLDFLLRPNDALMSYCKNLLIYGFIPVQLMLQVRDADYMLCAFGRTAAVVLLLFCMDPFLEYQIFGDYMAFGFNLALPSYCSLFFLRRYYHKRSYLVFEILALTEIIFFSNRSCLLSVFFLWMLCELLLKKHTLRHWVIYGCVLAVGIMSFLTLWEILPKLPPLFRAYGIESYALNQYAAFASTIDWENLFSGRFFLWRTAWQMFLQKPLLGWGTGAYDAAVGVYPHNIILEGLVQYGVIYALGMSLMIGLSVRAVMVNSQKNLAVRMLGILLLCLWFPKLLFSLTYFEEPAFWSFLACTFVSAEHKKRFSCRHLWFQLQTNGLSRLLFGGKFK